MHTANGLLDDLKTAKRTIQEVEALARGFVNKHCGSEPSPLMGANPDFDRGFLRYHMPTLEKGFHYRNFDVNAFWQLRQYLFGTVGERKPTAHRALANCEQAVQNVHDFVGDFAEKLRSAARPSALRRCSFKPAWSPACAESGITTTVGGAPSVACWRSRL
jgi:oligoribonuclease (3'-5' exoribonuclease)